VRGNVLEGLEAALQRWPAQGFDEIHLLGRRVPELRAAIAAAKPRELLRVPDYLTIVTHHNRRRR
jgi:hypothetical protein